MTKTATDVKKKGSNSLLMKFLKGIEVLGNKLPHPFFLFLGLWVLVMVLSHVFSGASAIIPDTGEKTEIISLLNREGIDWLLKNLVKNYSGFPSLGLAAVMMIGLGVTSESGLMDTAMKKIATVPEKYLVFTVFIVGICGNLASDAAGIIIPPLTASLFFSMKKNPIYGLALGYAAVSGGFTANFFIAGTDVLLSGITTQAYQIVDPNGYVNPACNYYFMAASVLVLSAVGTWFSNKFFEPALGQWDEKFEHSVAAKEHEQNLLKYAGSKKTDEGLKAALWTTIIYWGIMISLVAFPNGPLRDIETNSVVPSTFLSGIVPILFLYFVLVGSVYGFKVGTYENGNDVIAAMRKGISSMTALFVLILPISNFIACFKKSNMASVLAIRMANFLASKGITGIGLFIGITILTSVLNIFNTSGSAKWSLLAPVFVPMMYYLGYSPAWTQLLYRMGDSSTNIITPFKASIAILLAVSQKYDKDAGLGSIFSKTFPFAILFLVTWIIMMVIWFTFKIPFGPGVSYFIN